jgi:hypothetical protein
MAKTPAQSAAIGRGEGVSDPADHEVRISRVEAEVQSVARSVSDLVQVVKDRDERAERQHGETQRAIRGLAEQRGVSLSQILIGMASFVAAVGTFVAIAAAVITGVLYLAANQSKDASRMAVDRVEPRIAAIETDMAEQNARVLTINDRYESAVIPRFENNESDIKRIEANAADRFTGTQGNALEQRVTRLEALGGASE